MWVVLKQRQRFIAKMLGFYRPLEVLLGYFWGHKRKQPASQAPRPSIKHVEFTNFAMRKWLIFGWDLRPADLPEMVNFNTKLWKDPPFSYSML